ncbi:MAG TPA: hypothetical protein VIU63_10380 [Nitrospira sp.]
MTVFLMEPATKIPNVEVLMNYRIHPKRKPIKRLQLHSPDLLGRYSPSLRSSPWSIRWEQFVRACERARFAMAAWAQPHIRTSRDVVSGLLQRLSLKERTRRYGVAVTQGLSWVFERTRRGVVDARQALFRISQNKVEAVALRIVSRCKAARPFSESPQPSRTEPYPAESRSLHLSSQQAHQRHRELSDAHARLTEELGKEEEQLTRVATRVVRLQSLIRAHEQLLAETLHLDEKQTHHTSQALTSTDEGMGSEGSGLVDLEDLRSKPLFWRNEEEVQPVSESALHSESITSHSGSTKDRCEKIEGYD